jgi:hypothetical protein
MMRSLLLLLAEWYRDQVRASWEIAARRPSAAARRSPRPSRPGTGAATGGQLEPDPQWGPVVRDVFERRAQGAAWATWRELMNDRGVPVQYASGRGAARAAGPVRRSVASSPAGCISARSATARSSTSTPTSRWSPASVWHAAQHARGVQLPRADHDPALLSGLVRCAGCGYGMHRGKGRGAAGTTLAGYRCRGGGSGGQCPERAFAYGDALERLVVDEFLRHAADLEVAGSRHVRARRRARRARRRRHALEVFRDDPRVIGALGPDGFAAGLQERARRVERGRGGRRGGTVAGGGDAGLGDATPHLAGPRCRAPPPAAGRWDRLCRRRWWRSADAGPRPGLLGRARTDRCAAPRCPWRRKRPIALDGLPPQTRVALAGEVGEDG